jgi:predicted dehydrogenase
MDADRTPWKKELSWHDNPFRLELLHFRECVLEGKTPTTDGRAAVHDIALVGDIVRAHLNK